MTSTAPPSLRSLQAFSTVGRTGSVAAAARHLGVTSSAVSHLVRDLERQLAIDLFERDGDGRRITLEGRELASELGLAFDRIAVATERLRRSHDVLRITTVSAFADLWLAPRLGRFRASAPRLDLFVSTTTRAIDLDREDVDLAIRWGLGDWPDLQPILLFHERLVAVAHPNLSRAVTQAADVASLPRLTAKRRRQDWAIWAASAGVPVSTTEDAAMELETRGLAVRAALAGAGVLVVDASLVGPDLEAERLTLLMDGHSLPRPDGYWLVQNRSTAHRSPCRMFVDWLIEEARLSVAPQGTVSVPKSK